MGGEYVFWHANGPQFDLFVCYILTSTSLLWRLSFKTFLLGLENDWFEITSLFPRLFNFNINTNIKKSQQVLFSTSGIQIKIT